MGETAIQDRLPIDPGEWASRIENYFILASCGRRDGLTPFELVDRDVELIQQQAKAEYISEITRLTSDRDTLIEALRPSVNLLDKARSCHPNFDCNSDECVLEVFYGDDPSAFAEIKFGDLRKALAAIEKVGK